MKTKRSEMVEAVPRREIDLFDEMDRAFDTLFHRGWMHPFRAMLPEWGRLEQRLDFVAPRVDVIDREEEVLVRAEIPGVEKKDIHVDLSGQLLTIKGERRHEARKEKGEYFRAEIASGSFSRTIRMPEDVDREKAEAEFKDGMLEVRLPKTHKTPRRQIEVK
jgi:HSP20 family protein